MVDLTSEINELRQSPIFALSKGNNELSHTNFWAWLIEEIIDDNGAHPFVKVFIPEFYDKDKNYEYDHVGREDGHRDLSIYYKIKGADKIFCHVVENKLKSIPTIKQLREYESKIAEKKTYDQEMKFGGGTLTGIEETLSLKGTSWKFASYEKLAERIEKIAIENKNDIEEEYLLLVNMYVKDIKNISRIIKEKKKEYKSKYVWKIDDDGDNSELEKIKLADITLKQIGADYCEIINNTINSKNNVVRLKSKEAGMPKAELAFNNKKPTITVVYKKFENSGDTEKEVWRLGIQIEGKQFRIYGGPAHAVKPKNLYELFKDNNWLEVYNGKKIDGNDSGMRKNPGYCKYSTSEYTHLYQHWDIEKYDLNCTIDKLCDLIIGKLKFAKDLIDDENIGKEMTRLN